MNRYAGTLTLAMLLEPGTAGLWLSAILADDSRIDVNERATLRGDAYGVFAVAFSPDGKTLASGASDSGFATLKLWDVASAKERANLMGQRFKVTGLAFSPGGKTFASGGVDATVKLWNVATRNIASSFASDQEPVTSVAISPDGKLLAATTGSGPARRNRLPGRG